ncbi:uncharacterized protein Z518_02353 [Rhinocladiella mackenziei CBS 650.93]|uniref:Uncharacterized protein n=1 Tax=Rhinocladiella mackenziei CBS 650.93 TaxID=1442369 RepID=A0A0D2IPA3_9EURO|nr:uncharacterized protein Z518_02353 [Rhinocladiella mackenziei CBS 650.93]KIX07699.1 hypothetical protein Z518_02353 [Rhinocladiella mackenziei CBS 650.93]
MCEYAETPSTESETDGWDSTENEHLELTSARPKCPYARNPGAASSTRSSELINNPKMSWPKPISACLVDPFDTLPIEVDEVTNQLLHFYGQDSYWQTAYSLSPKIRPSIKGSWEYQAGVCVTHFHILMARSALHQLRMNEYATFTTRKHLEYAALKHQGSAVTVLRREVSRGHQADRMAILTSVISLATFEQRYGERANAVLHFKAGRDIVKQMGFADGLNGRLREEQALWFEGIYKDPEASFIWGKEDATKRLSWLRRLLGEVDRIWRDRQLLPLEEKGPFVAEDTRLHEFLYRNTAGRFVSVYGDIDEDVAQQRCVLIVVSIITGLYSQLEGKSHIQAAAQAQVLRGAIIGYVSWIENMLVEHDLGETQAVADMLWVMLQNYWEIKPRGLTVASMQALQRLDLRDCHWRACGIANVVKYLPVKRQSSLRDLLRAFIGGKPYERKLKFNEFEFSYAGVS